MSTTHISAAQMQQLLAEGSAQPLLPDHFPVPVRLDGRWWHMPEPRAAADATEPSDELEAFIPASDDQAALFEDLAERRHEAEHRMAAVDDHQQGE